MPYIAAVDFVDAGVTIRMPEIENEKQRALHDLIAENVFIPQNDAYGKGPYRLTLSIRNHRMLCLDLASAESLESAGRVTLPLRSFRKIVRDYFHICESYFAAVKTHSPAKIETIDMARRGIHDEGASLLIQLLDEQDITLDQDTARRLFTLICVLHIREQVLT